MLLTEIVPANSARVVGIDTIAKLTRSSARALVAAHVAYAQRYVELIDGQSRMTLDAVEVEDVTSEGLPLMVIQFGRSSGWDAQTGSSDGGAAARNLLRLLPHDTTLSCDLEGHLQSAQQAIDYAGSWYAKARSEGASDLELYVGAGVALTSAELYHALPFQGYFRSPSDVPDVAVRGYRKLQLMPLEQTIAGIEVDLSVVQTDRLGGRPRWARAA